MLFVADLATVAENRGVIGSLKRSRELTKGHRWPLFLVLLMVYTIAYAAELPMIAASFALHSVLLFHASSFIVQTALLAYGAALTAVVYEELRLLKDCVEARRRAFNLSLHAYLDFRVDSSHHQ